jgi:hypothetical protein
MQGQTKVLTCVKARDIRADFAAFEKNADDGANSSRRFRRGGWGFGFWHVSCDIGDRSYRELVLRDDPERVLIELRQQQTLHDPKFWESPARVEEESQVKTESL